MNFGYSYIGDGIYIGGVDSLADINLMNRIDQVVSMVEHSVDHGRDNYFYLCEDFCDVDIISYCEDIYPLLCLGKGTYVHCLTGYSRAVAVVMYYYMRRYKWSYEDVYRFMLGKCGNVLLNKGFEGQLRALRFY